MTTTAAAIAAQQTTLIHALTPLSQSAVKFREYDSGDDFREWAEESPAAALRRFYIEDATEHEQALSGGSDSEELEGLIEIIISYPKDDRFGSWANGRKSAMREDLHTIKAAVGIHGSANYVSGQNSCTVTAEIEPGESVDFLIMRLAINYRRSLS